MGLAGALQAEKETKIHINPGRMNYISLQNGRTHVIKLFLSGWFTFPRSCSFYQSISVQQPQDPLP